LPPSVPQTELEVVPRQNPKLSPQQTLLLAQLLAPELVHADVACVFVQLLVCCALQS
jgi:hypothetical protein